MDRGSLFNIFRNSNPVCCSPGIAPEWEVQNLDNHKEYIGLFVVFGVSGKPDFQIPGRIIEWNRFPVDVYIFDPPKQLRQNHEKGACLQLLKPDSRWFKLHWERPAKTFEESRAYVEEMLSEVSF